VKRRLLITGAGAVILGGAAAAAVLAPRPAANKPAADALPPATAKITRTTLVETKTVPGTLGYGDPVPISAAGSGAGTITWIAPVGLTVRRGEPLFKVDEEPVVALYGSLPLYRILRVGTQGGDVEQLEKNLAELDYTALTVDDRFTAATAKAVRTWQASLGVPATGTVEPDQVVFTPGAVRIAEHTARVGEPIGGGSVERGASVLNYTGTTRLVTVDLKLADQALAAQGRTVTVTVPGGKTVQGKISEVGTVATAQETASAASGGTSSAASDARIQVTVTVADQGALGSLNAAPVDVDLVSEERNDVLAVPVAALLALTDGGYGVEIVDGATTRIVAVKTGMFAAGRVEVSGEGIAEGMTVGVGK
jgi:peptidoglycan hydrolase-like protein with peptidoglycan-binding domain